jgi:STE24 endopeptidase
VGQFILEGFLSLRQYKVLQQTKPPKVLAEQVSQKDFDKSQVYKLHYFGSAQFLFA